MNKRMCGPSFETPREDARLLRMTRHVAAYWLAMTELAAGARCELCERLIRINDLAADHRQHRSDFSDLLDRRGQIVRRQHREIGEFAGLKRAALRSEEHTSELQSRLHLVCRLLLEKK